MKFMVVNSYTMMEELTLCTWNTMDESSQAVRRSLLY